MKIFMKKRIGLAVTALSLLAATSAAVASAKSVRIPMYLTEQSHSAIGYVEATDSPGGLLLTPHLKSKALSPGLHGFHIHINPSCDDAGQAAGGHLDPETTGKHSGPYQKDGHLGDLPALMVNAKHHANVSVLAPRLSVKTIMHHSLMIHEGGDNYSDHPEKMGGGGSRLACGVISRQ